METAVQEALQELEPPHPRGLRARHRWTLLSILLGMVVLAVFHYSVRLDLIFPAYSQLLGRFTIGGLSILAVLFLARLADAVGIERLRSPVTRYNLRRVLNLVVGVGIAVIVLSLLFANWYTAFVSLGVISLVVGMAVQTPMTSFIGWLYILIKAPYRVGDRIKIGDATGDVIEVGYLDTTLWEFGGDYLSTDHPSGRIIKFPNSNVLDSTIYNYSWALFPYVWNEIKFHVGYDSDLDFVTSTMQQVASEEIGEAMKERVRTFRSLLARTPVDQLEVKEEPSIVVRTSDNTWLEVQVRYLVEPKVAGRTKTRLIRGMLERLKEEPDRVRFPRGDAR